MTIARSIIWPGSFGDTSLPKINLGYTPPLAGAVYSWSADNLPLGPLTEWFDAVNGVRLGTDAGSPEVIVSDDGRAVSFDGVDDRMRTMLPEPIVGAHTVVVVYRLVSPKYGDVIVSDYSGAPTASSQLSVANTLNYVASSEGAVSFASPIAADTGWHVGIMHRDGANSALRIDSQEETGTMPNTRNRVGVVLGYGTQPPARSAIEVKRMDILIGALDAPQRATIANSLGARYGI